MEKSQSASLDQWGAIDWDDELEELCNESIQSLPTLTGMVNGEVVEKGPGPLPASKSGCTSEPTDDRTGKPHQTDAHTKLQSSHVDMASASSSFSGQVQSNGNVSKLTSHIPTPKPFNTHALNGRTTSLTQTTNQVSRLPTPKKGLGHHVSAPKIIHDSPKSFDNADGISTKVSRIPTSVPSFEDLASASEHIYEDDSFHIDDNNTTYPFSTSSPSTDFDSRAFAPGHPGWTEHLSPSVSSIHSTPPEVNRWVNSVPICSSLNDILEDCENCPGKAAVVWSALLLTDDEDFEEFMFPHGAMGWKTPLPTRFPARRPEQPRKSFLWQTETLDYSEEDLNSISSEASSELSQACGIDADMLSEDSGDSVKATECEGESKHSKQETTAELETEGSGMKVLQHSATDAKEMIQNSSLAQKRAFSTANEVTISHNATKAEEDGEGPRHDYIKEENNLLETAIRVPLPGFDLVDDFHESKDTSSNSPVVNLLDLINQLEAANDIMEACYQEIETNKELDDKAERRGHHKLSGASKDGVDVGDKERREESHMSILDMLSSMMSGLGFF
ncbi:hypothetical protein IWZ01DRAFT_540693 [Phyllosticta capitalensis]